MNSIFLLKKRLVKSLLVTCMVVCAAGLCGAYVNEVKKKIPDSIYVVCDDEATIDLNIPVTGTCVSNDNKKVNFNKPVVFRGSDIGTYKVDVKLFDIISVSTVDVNVVSSTSIYPCGFPIGMYLKMDGVLVVDIGGFEDYEGNMVSPCTNILKKGDYIVAVNGEKTDSKLELNSYINACKDDSIVLKVRRNGTLIDVSVRPIKTKEGDTKIGLWVKDDCQGIGTMTYITEDGRYGALGHGVSDSTVGEMLEISEGTLYKSKILSIVKGKDGEPGEYVGTINYASGNILGNITDNSQSGLKGTVNTKIIDDYGLEKVPLGFGYDVKKGPAYIRIYEDVRYVDYEIDIEEIRMAKTKNMTFEVTSEKLLEKTNGIVQGMSGSPIIQDGKLIGAVTHVLVNDPTRGYGIFIENMLDAEE